MDTRTKSTEREFKRRPKNDAFKRTALAGPKGSTRNEPCPCGSGRKAKKCCDRPVVLTLEGKGMVSVSAKQAAWIADRAAMRQAAGQDDARPLLEDILACKRPLAMPAELGQRHPWGVKSDASGHRIPKAKSAESVRTESGPKIAVMSESPASTPAGTGSEFDPISSNIDRGQ